MLCGCNCNSCCNDDSEKEINYPIEDAKNSKSSNNSENNIESNKIKEENNINNKEKGSNNIEEKEKKIEFNNINKQTNKISNNITINDNISKICAEAIDIYPAILNRISNVELYYLCENFIARDKYNKKQRSNEEIAKKLISFAKEECVDKNDINELKKINNFDFLTKYTKHKDVKELGKGYISKVFSLKKQQLLPSKHNQHSITFPVNNRRGKDLGKFQTPIYNEKCICAKILLSLFARQTKYYNTFIMKVIKGDKSINQNRIIIDVNAGEEDKLIKDDIKGDSEINQEGGEGKIKYFDYIFNGISKTEQYKEIARELLFSEDDHFRVDEFYRQQSFDFVNRLTLFGQPLSKNRILDKNGHIVDIDLSKLEPINSTNFSELYKLVKESNLFDLKEIFCQFKKNLTISPKLIVYHTLMELGKYTFKQFNEKEYVDAIKDVLKTYQALLSATKKNFKDIDKDIVSICEQQLAVYNKYLNKIDKYTLQDFKNAFQQEQEQITLKIKNIVQVKKQYRKNKKTGPLFFKKECNNNAINTNINNVNNIKLENYS